jgi:flagellar motility protein MotE (MotC chaperone)
VKNTIIYTLIFILAFAATTAGIYTLNNKFADIFDFDFREASVVQALVADSLAALDSLHIENSDSILLAENKEILKTEELKENLTLTKSKLSKIEEELNKKEKKIEQLSSQLEKEKTVEREEWLKLTVKLYEAMETAKAGDLLAKLPENEAREIIYSMKNKKAAEILSGLDTETVKRLTRSTK